MFYSPYYSGQDCGVSWLGRVKKRILEDKRTVATGQNTSTNETPYLRSLFSPLVLFAHFWIAKLENSREEGKNCRLLWWTPASSPCLPFFLSLCISMPWKFREAIVYQTEAWPIPAQRENVSGFICVILHSKICCGKSATKQNISLVEMRQEKDRAAVRSKVNRNTC